MWQFYHQRVSVPNQTYAIKVDKSIDALVMNAYVVFEMGISNCHPEDNFEKKIGRNVAIGRAEPHLFKVFSKDENITQMICQTTDIVLTFNREYLIGVNPGNFFV